MVSRDNQVVGFYVRKDLFRRVERAARHSRSLSEFVGITIKWCLENEEDFMTRMVARLLEAMGQALVHKEKRSTEGAFIQAVLPKSAIAEVDRFAAKMNYSRASALGVLLETGLDQSEPFREPVIAVVKPMVRAYRKLKKGQERRVARAVARADGLERT